jgi:hypothetical protein
LTGLLDAQGLGDLYELQYIAREEQVDFHVAYIGADFVFPRRKRFDARYLHHFYDYATEAASADKAWHESLPQTPPVSLVPRSPATTPPY